MPRADIPAGVKVTYRQQFRRCGKAGCSRCAPGARGHGPYWYAFWSEGGRQRSRYLGKRLPAHDGALADATQGAPAPPALAVRAEPLRIRTLGGLAVWRGATPIPPEAWTGRRARALLTCLLGAPGHRLQREQAIELLWPEADPQAGATNLRTTIHLLRRLLDGPGEGLSHLRTEGAALALAPGGETEPEEDWLDATAFDRAAQAALAGQDAAACRTALARYGGEYLPDDRYAPWAEQPRAALRRQQLELLLHLAALSAARGELEEAEGCLRRALAAEPAHEGAAATLMGLLAASGRRGEALQVYQALATVLEEELAVAPSAEVAALRARLLAQEAAPIAVGVPPRQGLPVRQTNLPVALTSFVGRAWELRDVRDALAGARLVTLTGPGGCGKTRLALEVADELVDAYPDGVWLAELAALADPALVPQALRQALGLREEPGRAPLERLRDFLRPRAALLVLDNCEHLIGACAELAGSLLQGCPRVRILATSREALGAAGERTYLVPSLATPDPAHLPDLERLGGYEAVALFLERARARLPGLALTRANAAAVAQVCARLDGLPLAIELAAARVGLLPVEAIAARLDDRFRLLTGGPRTALPRQQTLRATLDWSYALLSSQEQLLLQRLVVFAGGATLEAIEAVCTGEERWDAAIWDLLAGLVHKSLVAMEEQATEAGPPEARYALLETVRLYAGEHLSIGAEAAARRQHAAYYVALAEDAERELTGAQQALWLGRLDRENDNLRAVLRWGAEQGGDGGTSGLRLAGALGHFWWLRGHLGEGRRWLEQLLTPARTGTGRPGAAVLAKAIEALGRMMYFQGDLSQAQALFAEYLVRSRELGDRRGVYTALKDLGNVAFSRGNHKRALALYTESLAVARDLGDPCMLARALVDVGDLLPGERGTTMLEEGLRLARDVGDTHTVAFDLIVLGEKAYGLGEYGRARALLEEGLALCRPLGDRWLVARTLEALAGVTGAQGQAGQAARLFGAAEALREALGVPVLRSSFGASGLEGTYERDVAAMRAALGDGPFAAAWAAGRAIPLEQAVAEALQDLQPAGGPCGLRWGCMPLRARA